MDLQWPHHGAKNLTKTVFPAVSASQLSGVNSKPLALTRAPTNKNSFDIAHQLRVAFCILPASSETT